MLKTLSTESIKLRKSAVGVDDNSRTGHDGSEFNESAVDSNEVDSGKIGDDEIGKKF